MPEALRAKEKQQDFDRQHPSSEKRVVGRSWQGEATMIWLSILVFR
jgi:hypothetical protein